MHYRLHPIGLKASVMFVENKWIFLLNPLCIVFQFLPLFFVSHSHRVICVTIPETMFNRHYTPTMPSAACPQSSDHSSVGCTMSHSFLSQTFCAAEADRNLTSTMPSGFLSKIVILSIVPNSSQPIRTSSISSSLNPGSRWGFTTKSTGRLFERKHVL